MWFGCFLLITSYLPKTYIRPVLTSLLTTFFIILRTWLYNKPADYITIYKTSRVPTNAVLMINKEAKTHNLTG